MHNIVAHTHGFFWVVAHSLLFVKEILGKRMFHCVPSLTRMLNRSWTVCQPLTFEFALARTGG